MGFSVLDPRLTCAWKHALSLTDESNNEDVLDAWAVALDALEEYGGSIDREDHLYLRSCIHLVRGATRMGAWNRSYLYLRKARRFFDVKERRIVR